MGVEVVRRYGIDQTGLDTNRIEALVATGEWDEADQVSAAALELAPPNAEPAHAKQSWKSNSG